MRIDPLGRDGPTRGQSRGSSWRRTSPGLYVPADTDDTLPEQRIVEVHARAGTRAVITAWAALRLHRAAFFDGLARDGRTRLPVVLAANGERLETGFGARVIGDRIPPDDVTVIHGMPCAKVERALYDEMQRIGDVREMAVAAGATYAAKLTSIRRMRLYAATRRWYRDVRLVTAAVEMSCEGCRSPQEDRFRIIWEYTAGWGRPLVNRTLLDLDGGFLATPDLFDPVRGVVGEYAGADHRDIDRHARDIQREADLRNAGLEYVETVGRDLRDEARVVHRMEQAATRAGHLERRWQLAPPARPTLDEYLDDLAA
ncbi:hypothetical protein [Nocardioides hankookensis]|uniref:Uncharacterized protein n=1 Tax=Nocardioides hankookensis TaxID=443157 RepID=A0ABW1LQ05_9ACTN